MDATSMALHCVYSTTNARDAILKAVNLCGDSDSVGSVAGQIAGSAYGFSTIPQNWIKPILQWDNGDLALRAYRLFNHEYF